MVEIHGRVNSPLFGHLSTKTIAIPSIPQFTWFDGRLHPARFPGTHAERPLATSRSSGVPPHSIRSSSVRVDSSTISHTLSITSGCSRKDSRTSLMIAILAAAKPSSYWSLSARPICGCARARSPSARVSRALSPRRIYSPSARRPRPPGPSASAARRRPPSRPGPCLRRHRP